MLALQLWNWGMDPKQSASYRRRLRGECHEFGWFRVLQLHNFGWTYQAALVLKAGLSGSHWLDGRQRPYLSHHGLGTSHRLVFSSPTGEVLRALGKVWPVSGRRSLAPWCIWNCRVYCSPTSQPTIPCCEPSNCTAWLPWHCCSMHMFCLTW